GVIISLAAVKIVHPRRRNRHGVGAFPVLKNGSVVIQKPAVLPSLRLCLAADGIAWNAVPEVDGVREAFPLFLRIAQNVLKEAQLRVCELGRFSWRLDVRGLLRRD